MQNELMLSAGVRSAFKLDPRTKLILMFLVNLCIFGSGHPLVMLVMASIPIFLLYMSQKKKAAFLCAVGYVLAALVNDLVVPNVHGFTNMIVVMFSGMIYRMMPSYIMGYYVIITTTVSEFVAAMEKIKLPRSVIIPLSVVFRFFPTVGEEIRAINDAMRMRGVHFGSKKFFKNPISIIEYQLIPLLISTVKIGDELSAASLTRGLGNPGKRTNICSIGFRLQDYILIIFAVCGYFAHLLLR
jgi:energy-coupling factor transporter transmembrane protein EcfT